MEGIVVDTFMLRVVKEPRDNAELVVLTSKDATVEVDSSFEDPYWYKVTTATQCQGYVPKRHVAIRG